MPIFYHASPNRVFPDYAREAAEKIAASGGRLYAVGGSVRDAMMGLPAKDHDFSVVGFSPEDFVRLFPQAKIKGKDFSVFEWQGAEFALARTEKKIGRGHRGFVFHADPNVTIEDDLRRRDFTVNAIAVDVLTGEVVDPFGGVKDLKHGRLRAVTDAFVEDTLRSYRAARFSAGLGFDVTPDTIDLMRRTKPELASLSPERVFDELRKALRAERPSSFFRTLADADILDVHFPELNALRGVPQPPEHHPEGDAFEHTMQVVDAMARLTDDEALRWAAVVHDVGKGITPRERWPHHYGHEEAGVPLVEEMGKRLALPKRWTEVAREGTAWHMRAYRIEEMRLGKKVRFVEDLARSRIGVEGMALLITADHRGRNHPDVYVREADSLRFLAQTVLSVRGDHINAPPGPGFQEKLTQARIKRLQELQEGLAEFETRARDTVPKGQIRAPGLKA